MGFNSREEFIKYSTMQIKRVNYLREKYNLSTKDDKFISELVLNGFYKEKTVFLQKNSLLKDGHLITSVDKNKKKLELQQDLGGGGSDCKRRAYNCVAIATATAVAGHIACATVDFATLGISAYFCHGAVILMQIAMADNCKLDYRDCMARSDRYLSESDTTDDFWNAKDTAIMDTLWITP